MTLPGAETMKAGIKGVEIRRWAFSRSDNSAWETPLESFVPSELLAYESVGLVEAKPLRWWSCSPALMCACAAIAIEKSV